MARVDMVLYASELISMGIDIMVPFPKGTDRSLIPKLVRNHLGLGEVVWCDAPEKSHQVLKIHNVAISLSENEFLLRPGAGFLVNDSHIIYRGRSETMDFTVDGGVYMFPRSQEKSSLDVIDFRVKRFFENGYILIDIFPSGSFILNPVA